MLGLLRRGLYGGRGMTGRAGRYTAEPGDRDEALPRQWPYESAQDFGPYDSTVPTARSYARAVLAGWGLTDMAPVAELVLSELVTNALQATWHFQVDTPVGVRLLADSSRLVVEVWDSVRAAPVAREPDIAGELDSGDDSDGHGNGLVIIEAVSRQWGYVRCDEGGKIVYAILAR
jgi:anti-sigma regulatory factor (Ser/Thr protein kinase)